MMPFVKRVGVLHAAGRHLQLADCNRQFDHYHVHSKVEPPDMSMMFVKPKELPQLNKNSLDEMIRKGRKRKDVVNAI